MKSSNLSDEAGQNSRLFSTARRLAATAFGPRWLLLTNTVLGTGLLAGGDVLAQYIEKNLAKRRARIIGHQQDAQQVLDDMNWDRSKRMASFGFYITPFQHYWYIGLDRVFPSVSRKIVLTKMLSDQLFMGVFSNTSFLFAMPLMEGCSVDQCVNNVVTKFPYAYLADWAYWPIINIINFRFLPTHLRIVYLGFMTFFWNIFLSYLHHFRWRENNGDSTSSLLNDSAVVAES